MYNINQREVEKKTEILHGDRYTLRGMHVCKLDHLPRYECKNSQKVIYKYIYIYISGHQNQDVKRSINYSNQLQHFYFYIYRSIFTCPFTEDGARRVFAVLFFCSFLHHLLRW